MDRTCQGTIIYRGKPEAAVSIPRTTMFMFLMLVDTFRFAKSSCQYIRARLCAAPMYVGKVGAAVSNGQVYCHCPRSRLAKDF